MSCQLLDNGGNTLTAILKFDREQLFYDIKNCAFIEGSILDNERAHLRHTVQDVGEEGNADRVTRILDLNVSRCKELLYSYTKNSARDLILDDDFKEQKTYGIVMTLPEDFSQTTLNYLEKLIHEYLVATSLADWVSITNPAKKVVWEEKSEQLQRDIQSALGRRIKGVRIRLQPF